MVGKYRILGINVFCQTIDPLLQTLSQFCVIKIQFMDICIIDMAHSDQYCTLLITVIIVKQHGRISIDCNILKYQ